MDKKYGTVDIDFEIQSLKTLYGELLKAKSDYAHINQMIEKNQRQLPRKNPNSNRYHKKFKTCLKWEDRKTNKKQDRKNKSNLCLDISSKIIFPNMDRFEFSCASNNIGSFVGNALYTYECSKIMPHVELTVV